MPKVSQQKKASVKPLPVTPPPVEKVQVVVVPPKVDNRKVVYDKLEIIEYSTVSESGPLTIENLKIIFGWETESMYIARCLEENPGSTPEQWMADPIKKDVFGDVYHCRSGAYMEDGRVKFKGEKVRCLTNAGNRLLDMDWCEKLIHTLLQGQWAGPFTIPGETINGETVRISRYGNLISAQHQGTACILAGEIIEDARNREIDTLEERRYPVWKNYETGQCPFLETIVVRGMSEDERVLMTVDYVKPRSVADVFYTSNTFKDAGSQERKELCTILASAVDMLWTRTGTKGYRTHPEVVAFMDRHKSVLKCVLLMFKLNSAKNERMISKQRLSAGHCAALMYLMAASGTTAEASDEYRNMEPCPTEKGIDFSMWDKAEDFWILFTDKDDRDFMHIRTALGSLVDSTVGDDQNQGQGGRAGEKLAVISKAWSRWKDHPDNAGPAFTDTDFKKNGELALRYNSLDDKGNTLPDGQIKLLDGNDFLGVDCPESLKQGPTSKAPPDHPAPTLDVIQRLKDEAMQRRANAKR